MDSNIAKHFVRFCKRKLFQKDVFPSVVLLVIAMILHYGLGLKFYKLGNPILGSILFYTMLTLGFGYLVKGLDRSTVIPISGITILLCLVQVFPMHTLLMGFFPWYSIQLVAAMAYNIKVILFFMLLPLVYQMLIKNGFRHFKTDYEAIKTPWLTYVFILIGMSILIYWAAGLPSFQTMYPRYKPGYLESSSNWTYTQSLILFETSYVLQFVAVEYFFRGFILRVLAKSFGNMSVVLAVIFYVLIHFTKPLPEALGSAFGGFALCFLAVRTKSIKGGILLHVGVALMMEVFAFVRSS